MSRRGGMGGGVGRGADRKEGTNRRQRETGQRDEGEEEMPVEEGV